MRDATLIVLGVFILAVYFTGCIKKAPPETNNTGKLMEAVIKGDASLVSEELKQSLSSTEWNSMDGRLEMTPLHIAASEGHSSVARRLLDYGLKVDLKDKNGSTALIYAAAQGHTEVAKLLIERKADVNAEGTLSSTSSVRMTPVTIAASTGHTETLKLLLDNGGHLDQGSVSNSPLFFAGMGGHEDTVKFLLKRGAKVDSFVMVAAVKDKHEKIARLLQDQRCRELPQSIGFAAVDKELIKIRRMEGCRN